MDNESGSVARKSAALAERMPLDKKSYEKRSSIAHVMRSWLRHAFRHRHDSSLKEVLEEVIEEHEEQSEEPLAPEEKTMLHNMLSFSDLKVSDIMVPRAEIAAVSNDITLSELTQHIIEIRHTRVPVYEESLDQILGFIHVKDMLPQLYDGRDFDIKKLLRPLLLVPPSMRIMDLLIKMRHAGSHIAIVVDEYGGTDGLVTMEDVVEEIVGDIQDEHDGEDDIKDHIHQVSENVFEMEATVAIEKIEKILALNLVSDDTEGQFESLGGYIFSCTGRVPARGEIVKHVSGVTFEIIDADPRRIRKVRIVTPASK